MNIFTPSLPDLNADKFITKRTESSHHYNDRVKDSTFSNLVKEDSKSLITEVHSQVSTEKSSDKIEDRQHNDTHKDKEGISKDTPSADDSVVKTAEHTYDAKPEDEVGKDKYFNNTENSEIDEDTEGTDQKHNDQESTETGQVDHLSGEHTADPDDIHVYDDEITVQAGQVNLLSGGNISGINVISAEGLNQIPESANKHSSTDTGAPGTDLNQNHSLKNMVMPTESAKAGMSVSKDQSRVINEHMDTLLKNVQGDVNVDEASADDQTEGASTQNKGLSKNTGFADSNVEELHEDIELTDDLKAKIRRVSTMDIPERYAKKIDIGSSEKWTGQSQLSGVDPDTLDALNNIKTLQDSLAPGNSQYHSINNGMNTAIKGLSEPSVSSMESLNSSTISSNADMSQNQTMSMVNVKNGTGLLQSHASRTAGFSELLNQVVYVAKGRNKLGVTVNHEEFGKLKIHVSMDKGLLNIHVNASEKVVREFLETNVQSIIESLKEEGVSVGGFSVALKDHKGSQERNFLMDSGVDRHYENMSARTVQSARGLVNVFA